ncbi:MAG: 6-phosphogluconolactonase [Lentisphaerae bacterium]|nr:6-phosphogluconolactonase [Lentisphaerota bacterium]
MEPGVKIMADAGRLAEELAAQLRAWSAEAVAERGRFTVAIPGGSVIPLLGEALGGGRAGMSAWHWFWVDERCVSPEDPLSNVRQAREELFAGREAEAGVIHAPDGGRGPERAADAYEQVLRRELDAGGDGWPRFDLVVLGVGEDGHVASLFPGHRALEEDRRWVVPVRGAPKPPPDRISLTLPVINAARHVVLAAAGAGKAGLLERVWTAREGETLLPAQRVRPAAGGKLWLVDRAAAARLPASMRESQEEVR